MIEKETSQPLGISSDLSDFIVAHFRGSNLRTINVTTDKIEVEAGDTLLRATIEKSPERKEISYKLFSPGWNRQIRVEELAGFDYMETKVEEELHKIDLDMVSDDILLLIDLVRSWAKAHKYKVFELLSEYDQAQPQSKLGESAGRPRRAKKTKKPEAKAE